MAKVMPLLACMFLLLPSMLSGGFFKFANSQSAAAENNWLTDGSLHQALAQRVGIAWSNLPIRKALESLSKTQKIAIVLDRRVDPNQKIELAFEDVPLLEALGRIASRLQMGVTMLGPVAYFGPISTVLRLRTLAALRSDEASRLSPTERLRWTQAKPWKWPALSAPHDLLAALGNENGVQINGLDRIPADLWAAADLPPLTLPQRLTIVLAQFDFTYEPTADGTSLQIVSMPEKPVIERSYSVSGVSEVAAQLRQIKMLADAQIEVIGSKLMVRGRQEDQEAVNDMLSGRTAHRSNVSEGRKVYTLRVELPVGELLEALAKQMGVEIQLDRPAIAAAGISLETKVKVDVKQVSADELLHAVLEPVGLKYVQHDNVFEIKPK
ncbi:MAG TPA: hypothetical protein VFE46_07500 [Pirellulales bacterium]|jgi:hypothetical protein|nr:hypothetical protein [Pirellulales bacterium]